MVKYQPKRKKYAKSNKDNKLFRMKYGGKRGVSIWMPLSPRKGTCEICGKSVENGEIKFTNIHHMIYKYRPTTVKRAAEKGDYSLALENTVEVCYYDHNWMDALRTILSVDEKRFMKGTEFLTDKCKDELACICRLYLNQYDEDAVSDNKNV